VQKKLEQKKSPNVPSAMSAVRDKPLLPMEVVSNLDENFKFLYDQLSIQSADYFELPWDPEVFNREGYVHLDITDILELMTFEMLNISIIQIFCM
jgi:hypothetical protein